MSENENELAVTDEGQASVDESPKRFRLLWRLGCFIILALWFGVLLLPCVLIVLATQQEIVLSQGSLPGQQIRVWLVMEDAQRGLGLATTSTHPLDAVLSSDRGACLQTDVRYLLWQGEGEAVSYCECYTRADDSQAWSLVETYNGVCRMGGQ